VVSISLEGRLKLRNYGSSCSTRCNLYNFLYKFHIRHTKIFRVVAFLSFSIFIEYILTLTKVSYYKLDILCSHYLRTAQDDVFILK